MVTGKHIDAEGHSSSSIPTGMVGHVYHVLSRQIEGQVRSHKILFRVLSNDTLTSCRFRRLNVLHLQCAVKFVHLR